MAAHALPPCIQCVFSNLKRLGLGVCCGLCCAHNQAHPDEFVFLWNRRRRYRVVFDMRLGIELRTARVDYWTLVNRAVAKQNRYELDAVNISVSAARR